MLRKVTKIFLRVILGLVVLVLLIPVLLYVPFVQDFVVKVATEKVGEATGMKIEVGRLRLGFPLNLRLERVAVLQTNADTMLTARGLTASVKMLPLLKGNVDVNGLSLDSVFYQMGNRDSLMWLRAHIERGDIRGAALELKEGRIDLDRAEIDGADVWMRMLEDTVVAEKDTTASTPWTIKANLLKLKRVRYAMQMLPTIDSLGCALQAATLRNALVDMRTSTIHGQSLVIDSVNATYIYPAVSAPSSATAAAAAAPSAETTPWTITADTLRLTADNALYAMRGHQPLPGFDPSYISASGIDIEVLSFYNRATSITVPLRMLQATERCGLSLYAAGMFSMDDKGMRAEGFSLETLRSVLRLDASMGMGDMMTDPSVPLSLKANGRIDAADICMAFPDFRAMLSPFKPLTLSADIDGTAGELNVYALNLHLQDVADLSAQGAVQNPFDPDKIGGSLEIDGRVASLTDKQFSFLPIPHLPALALTGDVTYRPGAAMGDIKVTTSGGSVAADGSWTARTEDYDAHLSLDHFPVDIFMPALGVGRVTATAFVDGRGYNPMAANTSIDAKVKVDRVEYQKQPYTDIILDASLHAGEASGRLLSHNPGADMSVNFDAMLRGDTIRYGLDGTVADLNLRTLHLSDSVNGGRLSLRSSGFYNIATQGMDVTADVANLFWQLPGMTINPGAPLTLAAVSETTGADVKVENGDLQVRLSTPASIFSFVEALTPASQIITSQLDSMRVNVRQLSENLPDFSLLASMGTDNVVSDFLSGSGISLNHALLSLSNDSLINMHASLAGITSGTTKIDSVTVNAVQHGDYLVYKAVMDNRPGTFDDFAHVTASGYAGFNQASVFLNQQNIKGENGFKIGVNARLDSSVVTARFVPYNPVIAYKPWTLNKDNFLSYNLATRHLDADLNLTGEHSYLKVFTQHPEGADESKQEDLIVQISRIKLQDWLSINPFAPPVKGDLSADLRLSYEAPNVNGEGTVSLEEFYYGKERVGNFDLGLDVSTNPGGKVMADISLMVDSVKTITASGVLNDSTLASPFMLDFNMVRFPLRVVNPFIPQQMASLSGMLNGKMKVTGDMASPVFNGYINFDTTAVTVKMLGTDFRFTNENIPVDSNVVTFDGFDILACNNNPLTLSGTVDARHLSDIRLALNAHAREMQVVNSPKARKGADVYGKAFLNLDAEVRGNMSLLFVTADLTVLPATNVTYVMSDAQQTLSRSDNSDLVTFVNFADTASTASADSIVSSPMMLNLDADLHLRQGCVISADLVDLVNHTAGGSNKVQVAPSGDLSFSMSPFSGERLTGRLNINDGFVRYTPPLMSEKNFKFEEGSYIAFNGDMMNPVLNVHAVDVMRANVTQSGQNSRLVNFDVGLGVTGTLQSMNVAFDLSTNDDITVQNELQSMSAEQRANQAMNLLLYNTYTGAGTKGNASLSGNPLFSFLTSQLNNWTANNVKGVDISFGIDQYDRTYEGSTSTTTSYSYRVSKSLFNDRFKIVVGGNYSTDADTDENFAQNLINDISFQYILNRSGSMYVSIFRHTGYESILEGEITQTGVGFVLKRKINSLWELFGIRRD